MNEALAAEAVSTETPGSAGSIKDAEQTFRLQSERTVGVLLIGADFQSLGVIRALHEAGIEVLLVEHEAGIARSSRYLKRRHTKFDLLSDPDGVQWLIELANRESLRGWPIFCVDDDTVEFLAKNHAALSNYFALPVPAWNETQHFFEKDKSSLVARRCGVPVPREYDAAGVDELLRLEIEYPVILKPTFKKGYYSKTNEKAVYVADESALIDEYKAMNALIDESQILVQEFIPGGPRVLYSFAAIFDGKDVVQGLSGHRLRQHPMDFGHATTFAVCEDIPELEQLATRFLRELNYRGVAEVEFMFDERSQTYKFIEMNGRFWGWHGLAAAAGLNFPKALFHVLLDQPVQRTAPRIGAAWVRMLTDTPTILQQVLKGRMSPKTLFEMWFSDATDAVWSWKDPVPFIRECLIAPYLYWKKGF